MKARWLIRSFFIALLLFSIANWVGTRHFNYGVFYSTGSRMVQIDFHRRRLCWSWFHRRVPGRGWHVYEYVVDEDTEEQLDAWDVANHDFRPLGFFYINNLDIGALGIPFWFISVLAAAALWIVWRKTRPADSSNAFPVNPPS